MRVHEAQLAHAADLIRTGSVVAFPTETVYGLGADATNDTAVQKIFHLKGRPSHNPLIVHLAHREQLSEYVTIKEKSRVAEQLERLCPLWPGPLTIVFPEKKSIITDSASAGLSSVGIRVPNHPVARSLLELSNRPIAAPSANMSEYVSATTVDHVRDCFGDTLCILDGGPSSLGIESTIVQLSEEHPAIILRPGSITRELLSQHLMEELSSVEPRTHMRESVIAPGQLKKHYAPRTPLYFIENSQDESFLEASKNLRVGKILFSQQEKPYDDSISTHYLSTAGEHGECAKNLYATIRNLDKANLDLIVIEKPKQGPLFEALYDRLKRAVQEPKGSLSLAQKTSME
ncbi:MAG: L-threonylcarbamoyladenylate synthase [Bdellovibrionota bacterium]|jgi:L-threonylcarbamoyladenylate synthase